MKDFFISFTRTDRGWAEWIAWELEAARYSVVFQDWDFGAGSDFVVHMQRATLDTSRTIAVMSPHYFAAQFTWPEWSTAFAQDPVGQKQKLVPVRVADFKPPGMFTARVYVDLFGVTEVVARKRILEAIKTGRRKPVARPIFPGAGPAFPGAAEAGAGAGKPGFTPALRSALEEQWKVCVREQLPVHASQKLLVVQRVAPTYVKRVFAELTPKIFTWIRNQAEKQVLNAERVRESPTPLEEDRTTVVAREIAVSAGAVTVDIRHYLLAILDDHDSRTVAEIRKKIEATKPGGFAALRNIAESASLDDGARTDVSSLDLDGDY
jgi:hypothetical protein